MARIQFIQAKGGFLFPRKGSRLPAKRTEEKLKLEEDDVECFRQHSQTQGRNTNYLVQSCPYNPVRARDLE